MWHRMNVAMVRRAIINAMAWHPGMINDLINIIEGYARPRLEMQALKFLPERPSVNIEDRDETSFCVSHTGIEWSGWAGCLSTHAIGELTTMTKFIFCIQYFPQAYASSLSIGLARANGEICSHVNDLGIKDTAFAHLHQNGNLFRISIDGDLAQDRKICKAATVLQMKHDQDGPSSHLSITFDLSTHAMTIRHLRGLLDTSDTGFKLQTNALSDLCLYISLFKRGRVIVSRMQKD